MTFSVVEAHCSQGIHQQAAQSQQMSMHEVFAGMNTPLALANGLTFCRLCPLTVRRPHNQSRGSVTLMPSVVQTQSTQGRPGKDQAQHGGSCAKLTYCSGEPSCCPGGAGSISTRIIPATDGQPEETLRSCCRVADQRPINDGTASAACQSILTRRDHVAFDLASRPVRRGIWDDPLRQMSFRDGTIRAQISPHLLADLLVNDWEFDYR